MDEAHVIRQGAEIWNQLRDHFATAATRLELPRTFCQGTLGALKSDEPLRPGHVLPVPADQLRLVVKRVHLADRAGAKNHQHILRPRLKMRIPDGIRIRRINLRPNGNFF